MPRHNVKTGEVLRGLIDLYEILNEEWTQISIFDMSVLSGLPTGILMALYTEGVIQKMRNPENRRYFLWRWSNHVVAPSHELAREMIALSRERHLKYKTQSITSNN